MRIHLAIVAILGGISSYAFASGEGNAEGTAEVLDVVPIVSYERVSTPHRVCTTTEPRYRRVRNHHHRHDHGLNGVLGGILGGAIGHQFGGGNGKRALTVIGAIAGSNIARSASHHHHRDRDYYVRDRGHRRCRTTYDFTEHEHIEGYRVTFAYEGQEYERIMPEHPGDQVRVEVEVIAVPFDDAGDDYDEAM